MSESVVENGEPKLSSDQLKEIQHLLLSGAAVNPASEPDSEVTYSEWSTLSEVKVDDKNPQIHCPRCPSKICLSDTATFVESEMKMSKYKQDAPDEGVVTKFWMLTSLMAFENIGVSHLVENIKFLSCADCEVGPIGWHDVNDRTRFYIAAERVRYSQ